MEGTPISSTKQTWSLMEVLKSATDFLKTKSIENPRLNAEQMLATCLNLTRMKLYLQFDRPLSQEERDNYKELLRRRAEHEPLQYIIRQTEFMSLPFQVEPSVLIPRPETETLVETVLDLNFEESVRILDIGTGSGCIAISLAHYLPNAKITAVDKFDDALQIAKANAELNQTTTQIHFLKLDVMDSEFISSFDSAFDILVSNPPYVTSEEYTTLPLEIREHEPIEALTDHDDGLTFYRRIAETAKSLVKPGGFCLVEVGDTQSQAVQKIFNDSCLGTAKVLCDLNNIERVIQIKIENEDK